MSLSIQADASPTISQSATPGSVSAPSAGKLIATPAMKFDKKTIHMSAVRGTTGPGYTFVIQNRSSSSFKLVTESFIFGGEDAEKFEIVGGRIPRTIQAGAKAVFKVAFKAGAGESLSEVFTATLSIKASSAPTTSGRINLRAIATQGEGGSLEPSLARIIDLYGYTINVGDSDKSTTALDLVGGQPNDEIYAPKFQKSGSGPVTITPIAQFVSDADIPGRLGYYNPGNPNDRTELFTLNEAFNQAVAPDENGTLIFDPGSSPFSLYAQIPVFLDDGEPRRIYGEDALNTWESNADDRRKVRVYQLSENGSKVEGAYVVTFEDYDLANDQNDYVYVIRGVQTTGSGPEIGLIAQNNQPFDAQLSFNEIGVKNSTLPNRVYNQATVRIVNTGNRDLVISSIGLSSDAVSSFQIIGGPTGSTTVARNGTLDVTVRFIATSGDLKTGSLIINSNDRDERATTVSLSGFWQSVSESNNQGVNQEPDLNELLQLFNFGTKGTYSGQSLDTDGQAIAVGDEVLSAYWERADGSYPVKVTDLATFHNQGTSDEIAWVLQGQPFYGSADPRYPGADDNGPRNSLFFTKTDDGQTLFPRTTAGGSPSAVATFSTDATFGFRVNGEFSDDSLNIIPSGQTAAHHWRFYPAKRLDGTTIPNAWLGVMDFAAINYDYNDNLLLIENVRPADLTAGVANLAGYSSKGDAVLDWEHVADADGYQVLRSNSSNGTYSAVGGRVSDSFFVDATAESGNTYYYRVAAYNSSDDLGMYGQTRVAV